MSGLPVRLLLVDDHEVVRRGLADVFGTLPRFSVVGQAGSVAEAVAEAARCEPDVVLMDLRLPDGSGVQACREIRAARPQTKVLMLTSYSDEEAVIASILAGAAGYLLKRIDGERLVNAVETVAHGGLLLDQGATETFLKWMRGVGAETPGDPLAGLSEQQRRILPLIADGKTNREIAAALFLSELTVKSYVSDILEKLNLTSRAEAAAFITRHCWQAEPVPTHGTR